MAAYTSAKSGNWSDPATWSPVGVPGAADTVTIASPDVVAVDVPSTAASVVVSATDNPAFGVLRVNSSLDLTLASGTALLLGSVYGHDVMPVMLAIGPGGSIVGNPTSGNTVTLQVGGGDNYTCGWSAIGTGWGAGQFAEVKNAGTGAFNVTIGGGHCGTFTGTYVKFTGIGSATTPCIATSLDFNLCEFLLDHARFSGCGKLQISCQADSAFRFNDVQFSGSVDATYSVTLAIDAPSSGVERTHDLVSYDIKADMETRGLSITNTFFGGGLIALGDNNPQWPTFSSNFLHKSGSEDTTAVGGDVTNSYIIFDSPGHDNPHYILNEISTATSWSVTGNIFDGPAVAPSTDQGDALAGLPLIPVTVTGNLILPIAAGTFAGWACCDQIASGGGTTTTVKVEHNTVVGSLSYPAFYFAEGYAGHAGMFASVRSNLVVDLANLSGKTKIFGPITIGTGASDVASASNVTNNGGFNLASGVSGAGYTAVFTSGSPGAGDVHADPGFVDPTRNFPTWAVSQGSTGSTMADRIIDGLAYLQADPSLIASSLMPWVRAGFAPTNAAFHDTAHDGTDIGAVAYQSVAPPSLTAATPSSTVIGPHEIDLTWGAASGGTSPFSYQVQRAPDVTGSAGTYAYLGTAGTGRTYADTQLGPGVTYHYQIVVTDSSSSPQSATSAETHATTSLPDIPNYALWWSRMASYPSTFDSGLVATADNAYDVNNQLNHDGIYGSIQSLGYRPGNADLTTYLAEQLRFYRDDYLVPDNGALPGYYLFPEGLGLDWEQNGSTASRDALILMAQHGAYVSQPGADMSTEGLSRENAYSLLTWIEVDRLGLIAWDPSWVIQLVDNAMGHIGLWLGDPAVWTATASPYIQPFMMGITGIALGKYLDYIEAHRSTTDARILPALSSLAVRMRERWWRPASGDFIWPIYADGTDHNPTTDNTVLNLESTNFFGWLYHRTGSDYFKTAGDEPFGSGIATTQIYNPKQWNQQYRWSFLYVGWRGATPSSNNNFYVLDPPFIPNGTTGVASSSFIVAPLGPITGTIIPSDGGAGGSFTPTSLTFAGSSTPATFTYTPAAVGTATISVTNTAGLTDPATVRYQAQAPTPIPTPATVPTPIPAATKKILFPPRRLNR